VGFGAVSLREGETLRRLYFYFGVLLVVVAAILMFAATAGADPPPPGSHPVQFTDTNPTGSGFVEPVYFIDPTGGIMPSATCAFATPFKRGAQLTADVKGWETDPSDFFFLRTVSLHAQVQGTVTDTAGNVFRLNGNFDQSGLQRWPSVVVPFDGFGHLTLAGPAGVITGDAEYRDVDDNPAEWAFYFTRIQVCKLR
jgi:hypothetical protein